MLIPSPLVLNPPKDDRTTKLRRPPRRRTRTQRRRDGNARAAALRKGSERIEDEKDEKPAPVELTIAERRIKEKLEQHWHEPDPWAGPIDSTHPGRSPPRDRDPTTQLRESTPWPHIYGGITVTWHKCLLGSAGYRAVSSCWSPCANVLEQSWLTWD